MNLKQVHEKIAEVFWAGSSNQAERAVEGLVGYIKENPLQIKGGILSALNQLFDPRSENIFGVYEKENIIDLITTDVPLISISGGNVVDIESDYWHNQQEILSSQGYDLFGLYQSRLFIFSGNEYKLPNSIRETPNLPSASDCSYLLSEDEPGFDVLFLGTKEPSEHFSLRAFAPVMAVNERMVENYKSTAMVRGVEDVIWLPDRENWAKVGCLEKRLKDHMGVVNKPESLARFGFLELPYKII